MRTLPITCVLAIGLCAGATSCGGEDAKSQATARDRATVHSCDKLMACQQMGGKQMYDSRASCEIDQRATWEKTWPPAECDGKIQEAALATCLDTIDLADCASLLDFVQILAKCPKEKICAAPNP